MRNIFLVGAKLIGLTFLLALLGIIPAFSTAITWTASSSAMGGISRVGVAAGYALYFGVTLLVIYLLLVRTELLADVLRIPDSGPTVDSINARTGLRIGLILVGVYIIVTTVPDLLREVLDILSVSGVRRHNELEITAAVLKAVLAGYILLRPSRIIEWLWAKKEQEPAAA